MEIIDIVQLVMFVVEVVAVSVVRKKSKGNCYVTCEAIYHLLGGKGAGYKPMHIYHEGESHWFLKHSSGIILDPTISQFKTKPDYSKAVGKGFLTRRPSKRARELMSKLVWS